MPPDGATQAIERVDRAALALERAIDARGERGVLAIYQGPGLLLHRPTSAATIQAEELEKLAEAVRFVNRLVWDHQSGAQDHAQRIADCAERIKRELADVKGYFDSSRKWWKPGGSKQDVLWKASQSFFKAISALFEQFKGDDVADPFKRVERIADSYNRRARHLEVASGKLQDVLRRRARELRLDGAQEFRVRTPQQVLAAAFPKEAAELLVEPGRADMSKLVENIIAAVSSPSIPSKNGQKESVRGIAASLLKGLAETELSSLRKEAHKLLSTDGLSEIDDGQRQTMQSAHALVNATIDVLLSNLRSHPAETHENHSGN
jgi:hypothetical protein